MSDKKKRNQSHAARATQAAREARARAGSQAPRGDDAAPDPEAGEAEEAAEVGALGAPRVTGVEAVEFKGGGGLLSGMRTGFQSAVGVGGKKKKGWVNDLIFVLLVLALVAFIWGSGR